MANVAKIRPPITARPSGAFCSPPSPSPSDMGSMPMIMASAVIRTGRSRVYPAESAASMADFPSRRSSLAKVTMRMLFAVPTPIAMIAPMSEGTFSVVPHASSIQMMPHIAPGSAMMMMKGSVHDWKFTTSRK